MSYALKRRLGDLGLIMAMAGGVALLSGPAQAAGCNGHVNIAEWGCAPWDNNNGPQYGHYKAPAKPAAQHAAPPAHLQPQPKPQVQTAPPSVFTRQQAPGIMGNSGGNVVGSHGSGVVSQGGGNVVSQGGGNAISNNGSALKPGARNGVVSQGGGNVVSQGGGNVVSQGGGNFQHR